MRYLQYQVILERMLRGSVDINPAEGQDLTNLDAVVEQSFDVDWSVLGRDQSAGGRVSLRRANSFR